MGSRNSLLTTHNVKIAKSTQYGYYSAILHLAAANISGYEVCPGRSEGCTSACNGRSGRGRFDSCQLARINKTRRLFEERQQFIDDLNWSIETHTRKCNREGLKPAIRLNGTSDLPWWSEKYGSIIQSHPNVQFYDYTKVIGYLNPEKSETINLKNYCQVFSRSENNLEKVKQAIKWGYNVAVAFELDENKKLPKSFMDLPVRNGDKHDLIFKHRKQCIIGLRYKKPRDVTITDRMKMMARDYSGFTVLYDNEAKQWIDPQETKIVNPNNINSKLPIMVA